MLVIYDAGTVGHILMIVLTAGLWYSGTVVLQLIVHRGHPWHKSSSPPVPSNKIFVSFKCFIQFYKKSFNYFIWWIWQFYVNACSNYCGSNLESNSIFMTYIVLLCLRIRMEWFVSQFLGMLIRIWWVTPPLPPQSTEIHENWATMRQINYNDSTVLANFPYTQNLWTYRSPLVAGTRRDVHIRSVL